jgi:FimV-like protein
VNGQARTNGGKKRGLTPTYIPRLMPIGMIVILLMILIPILREKKTPPNPLAQVEPPLAMVRSETGFASTDSLIDEALRDFGKKNYTEATHLLSKVYFYWNVQIRTGKMKSYPEDLRYYLGLSELFRGRPDRAVPYLEAEHEAMPFEEKYAWYLAHAYIALGEYAKARGMLERVVRIGDAHAEEARRTIERLPPAADSTSAPRSR